MVTYYIYCITNKINNKTYVGQSIDAKERWKDHISDAKRKIGKTAVNKKFAIHNALLKYGEDNFIWQIIDQYESQDEVNEAEEFYVAYLQTLAPNGYNLTKGGNNHSPSLESRAKISETLKITGYFVGKKGSLHPNFGKKQSKKQKEEQSKKLSGNNGPNKKINSQIAREIYLLFLNNEKLSTSDIEGIYNIKQVAILNILNKKCWKEATKDLPDIDLSERQKGGNWKQAKIDDNIAKNILQDYFYNNLNPAEITRKYKLSYGLVFGITSRKTWKHIKY